MNKILSNVIDDLTTEGKDYSDFKILLSKVEEWKEEISKDDILEFVSDDFRIHLHTTPNSIAQLISHLACRNMPSCAIDICCGTGNILYYLQNSIDDLTGVEIVENVSLLTSYFNPELYIITADTFKYPFTKKYDLVVGNIPRGMKVDYNGKRIGGEEAFIRKALDLCNENGEVILLVPYNVLISTPFRTIRNELNLRIREIIGLPAGIIRSMQAKSALIVIGGKSPSNVKMSLLTRFDNLTKEYDSIVKSEIPQSNLVERWDPEFHLKKESTFYKELDSIQTVKLKELAKIVNGRYIPADSLKNDGQFLYLKPSHILGGKVTANNSMKYVDKSQLTKSDLQCIVQPGDILISTIFTDLKMCVYSKGALPAFASNNLAIIRSSSQDYILSYLQTEEGKRVFKSQADELRKGSVIPHITTKDIEGILIPILPMSELNMLGDASIEKATKGELLNNIDLLKSFRPVEEGVVNEPEITYGEFKGLQMDIILSFIDNRINKVVSQLSAMDLKLDKLLELITELKTDFDKIKALPRDTEEKIFKLCQKIDNKLNSLYDSGKVDIDNYIEGIKRWLDLWELLDDQSQRFLPIAEFIFDELSRIPDADYSPFVVQYCRTLENEILKKLFESYHSTGLTGMNREELVKGDIGSKLTGKFASMVQKNKKTYTLGEMKFIMSLIRKGGDTLGGSLLLQHFRLFTIDYFDERIIEANFLNDIDKLTIDFRNKAAHPYSIGIDMAKQCQELLRRSLNVFLESIKRQ